MQFLLRRGADPTAMDIDDCSPLSSAAGAGCFENVRCLLRLDVITELTRRQGSGSSTYLSLICLLGRSAQFGYNDVVDHLLKAWDYPTGIVEPGDKAVLLTVAAARGNTALV